MTKKTAYDKSNSVKIDDSRWQKILKNIDPHKKAFVKVGILSGESDEEGTSLVDIGMFHEFGTETIPERSWLRSTFEKNEEELIQMQKDLSRKVIVDDMPLGQALNLLGSWAAEQTKKNIIDQHIPPPLKQSTIDRKGSDHPLIDTGQMVNAITWEVREDGKDE